MKRYILSNAPSQKMAELLDYLQTLADYQVVEQLTEIELRAGDILVIAADLDDIGDNCLVNRALGDYLKRPQCNLWGVICGIFVYSDSIYHTKDYAKRLSFVLNLHGAQFNGHALFELVADYKNLQTWQKVYQLPLEQVCQRRIAGFHAALHYKSGARRNKIVALHASERHKSNTLTLWEMVSDFIPSSFQVKTLHIENGEIVDCKGCDFRTCLHFAKQNSCYYGGRVTRELLPAIEWADIVVWICPNYNDAVSAMHTALINRLTVLYRKMSLADKQVYGVVVSANSGSDVVATQLIDALNFNKGFMLPPQAMLCATANDPAAILKVANIKGKAERFAQNIVSNANL